MVDDTTQQAQDSKIADKYDFDEDAGFSKKELEAGRLLFSGACDFIWWTCLDTGMPRYQKQHATNGIS